MSAPTLVSSWGGTEDTVYALLAEANDYIGSDDNLGFKADPSPWIDLTTIQRGRFLLAATRDVDNAANYIGERQFEDQRLQFPRIPAGETEWPWVGRALTEANTYNFYLTEQKRRVKEATIEQAFFLANEGDKDEHTQRRLKGIRSFSESVGPISESASYGGNVSPLCPEAMRLLGPYMGGGIELVRG